MKYTKKLKKEILNKLFNKNGKSINQHIHKSDWFKQNNLLELQFQIYDYTRFFGDRKDNLTERIYCILNDIYDNPNCYCSKNVKFKRFGLGYSEFCSTNCRANSKDWLKQVKETRKQKYGVEHIAQLPDEKQKRSKSLIENRKNMDYSNAPEKRKKTIERKYGINYNSGWNTKAIQTRIKNKNMVPPKLRVKYNHYYKEVVYVTQKQPLHLLKNIEKRGVLGIDENAHHIDHVYPIYHGFLNDIDSKIIGHISNLQCIPATDNITKGNNTTISINELYERYESWKKNLTE